ncbi:MAG: GNAT family N-acetyltransferase [Chloroflexota bacterium]|mgnify:CR=1 FL=1
MDIDSLQIVHNPAEQRFETVIEGKLCKLDYLRDGNRFVITHVGVHPSLRGQGIAGKIVEAALQYARENSLRVIPMCSYAAAYIRRHPEHADLTKQDTE